MPLPLPVSLIKLAQNPYLAVGAPVILGIGSGLITRSSVNTWYKDVKKPPMEPPRLAFPVAWTYLYATMGYASHLISLSPLLTSSHPTAATAAHTALSLYYAQFAGNMLWTPLFFGLNRTGLALLDIVGLTGTVLAMTAIAKSVNRTAFLLFLPYCAWLSFATYLNGGVWYLNGGKKRLGLDKKGKGREEPKKDL